MIRNALWGRALPALVFQFLLLAKAVNLVERLKLDRASGVPILAAFALQQGLGIAFLALCVVLFVTRRPTVGRSSSLPGALAALAGTFLPYVPITAPVAEDQPALLLGSSVLLLVGLVWAVVSLAYLGRCFGLFPEARGLVERGPYRWIRHPLYLGELVATLGLVLATASPVLFGVFLALVALQYTRARLEERALSEAFPAYADYQQRTYRIVPWVH
jgi:protein-S-isoprenylcysteine O-methyltransferase Ste14